MTNAQDRLPEIISMFTPDIVNRFAEVTQSRSRYQLEKFVMNQHDTDEMRYVQIVTEIQSMYYSAKNMLLEMKKNRIKIDRLRATGDEIAELEAQQIELSIEQAMISSIAFYREMQHLTDILEQFPRYTREQIENNQPEYWHKRMYRQAEIDATAGTSNLAGHLTSLLQMGELKYEYPPMDAKLTLEKEVAKELV